MDRSEEPMDLDSDVTFTEIDKFDDSVGSNTKPNDVDITEPKIDELPVPVQESRYENRGGAFTTGIDIFSKEEKLKMEERAKRFGLIDKVKKTLGDDEPELYTSMGVVEENENMKNLRLNVLHMRGTEEMSTQDVFKYFEDYAPASIEWINDISCNIVWVDNVSAARALLGLSKRIKGLGERVRADKDLKSEASNFDDENNLANDDCVIEVIGDDGIAEIEDKKDENSINIKDIQCPLPPGLWRKGIDCPKSKGILLRFATRADKKQPKAEKMSEYYKKYGNPNFGGVKGILTESRKRMYKELRHSKKKTKESKYDDENDQRESKNPWGDLSQTWGVNDSTEDDFIRKGPSKDQGGSVKERLGLKPQPREVLPQSEESEGSSESDSDEEWCKRSKVLRMRMHADDEEIKVQKRRTMIQHRIATTRTNKGDDLRSRLGRSRRPRAAFPDAIQVVVTNSQVGNCVSPNTDGSEEEEGEIVEEMEDDVKEEGEWQEKDHGGLHNEEEDNDESEDSEKEIQGPRGSVVKVVQHKPRLASTVWARLNHKTTEDSGVDTPEQRRSRKGDLRDTLRGGDLRSRLGKPNRCRSPLRIEVKNDKYAEENSDSE